MSSGEFSLVKSDPVRHAQKMKTQDARRAAAKKAKLVGTYTATNVIKEAEDDESQKLERRRELAAIYEKMPERREDALRSYLALFDVDPAEWELRKQTQRLARELGEVERVAQAYQRALAVLSQDVVVNPTSTSAGQNVQYTATITNNGTGVTDVNGASFIEVTLPAGFTFCGVGDGCTQPTINTAGVADPAGGPNNTIVFTDGLVPIAANGGTLVLVFDVTVDAGVAADQYTVDVQTTVDDPGVNKDVEISVFGVAPLLVDTVQSDPPVLDDPVLAGATVVTGVTSEGIGATVTVAVNGNTVNPVVAQAGGIFSVIVPTLYAGQHLNATAQTAGEIESDWSSPDVIVAAVGGTTQCNDRIDNDGDNLVDYPDDPGCTDALDLDETDVPECSDGIDNDTDNLVDFPDDPSCSSYLDDDESGPPACSDGVDNDGDTLVDFPDDPGCQDANDINEDDIAACANGLDDDGDTLIDYPNDPGCSDVYDDDETDATGTGGSGGAGGGSGGAMGTGGGAMGAGGVGNGVPPDLGGLGLDVASGDDSGCGCRVAGERVPGGPWWLLLAATLTGLARRCRRRS